MMQKEFDPGKTVKIPVYSSIKLINGILIYELEGYEDIPVGLLTDPTEQ
ncbi:hypothetical protein ABRT01_02280 [Lentibacillus sp. L22]|nr:hypothetical protein [Lentibacillus daqui]